jgi:outer membrane protein OmpA-like peptidoglycan-associated protein
MKRMSFAALFFLLTAYPAGPAKAGTHPDLQALTILMDSARALEAPIFAPGVWQNAEKQFTEAQAAVDQKKKEKNIQENIGRARQSTENAIKACEVAKLSLAEYLAPRNKARAANAPTLVAQLYTLGETQFVKATQKVENGDVKGGLKEAAKAVPLFDNAELQAIRTELLGNAQKLIAKAKTDEAEKYAPSTLDRALKAFAKADGVLAKDRYERKQSLTFIADAEYEALHASNIAQSVRALERNDQAWEKLMLIYELQMNKVGEAAGLAHLPFDKGPLAAADTLVQYVRHGQSLQQSTASLQDELSAELRQSLGRMGDTAGNVGLVELARRVDDKLAMVVLQRDDLQSQIHTSETKLAQVEWEQASVSEELNVRLRREERFKAAKEKIRPSEGEVLWNSSNDLVLRLTGLKFDVGSADIKDDQMPLLDKVVEIIQMSPNARLVVEGHTDASGDAATNLQLSEKRAYSLMMYLRTATGMTADRIKAIGYGSEKPIASNDTPEGRAKNRRNDIIIMQ